MREKLHESKPFVKICIVIINIKCVNYISIKKLLYCMFE